MVEVKGEGKLGERGGGGGREEEENGTGVKGDGLNVCPDCGKKFERLSNLKAHRRKHTGETPYKCKILSCAKSFKWKSSLSSHMKSHEKSAAGKGVEGSAEGGGDGSGSGSKKEGGGKGDGKREGNGEKDGDEKNKATLQMQNHSGIAVQALNATTAMQVPTLVRTMPDGSGFSTLYSVDPSELMKYHAGAFAPHPLTHFPVGQLQTMVSSASRSDVKDAGSGAAMGQNVSLNPQQQLQLQQQQLQQQQLQQQMLQIPPAQMQSLTGMGQLQGHILPASALYPSLVHLSPGMRWMSSVSPVTAWPSMQQGTQAPMATNFVYATTQPPQVLQPEMARDGQGQTTQQSTLSNIKPAEATTTLTTNTSTGSATTANGNSHVMNNVKFQPILQSTPALSGNNHPSISPPPIQPANPQPASISTAPVPMPSSTTTPQPPPPNPSTNSLPANTTTPSTPTTVFSK